MLGNLGILGRHPDAAHCFQPCLCINNDLFPGTNQSGAEDIRKVDSLDHRVRSVSRHRKNIGSHASLFENRVSCLRAGTGDFKNIHIIHVVGISVQDRSDLKSPEMCRNVEPFRIKMRPLLYFNLRSRVCRHNIESIDWSIWVCKVRLLNIRMRAHLAVRYDRDPRITLS